MNVISMKKKLLAGEFPGESGKTIHLKDTQIKYLAATVPCIKIHNSNATKYYFPEAETYLHVQFFGGNGRYETKGSLFKVSQDYEKLFYENGTRKYLVTENLKPVVSIYPAEYKEINDALNLYQSVLWIEKKPYHVKMAGYGSVHKNGWPKDAQFGREKTTLSIREGDFETVYLTLEEISTQCGNEGYLKEAILNGEYDGVETPDKFAERVDTKAQKKTAEWTFKYEFEKFIKNNPIEQMNTAIEDYNNDIAMYKKFLKMATTLRKKMKANPGYFRKVKKVNKNTGLKNSDLFREKKILERSQKARHEDINETENNKSFFLHWAVEKAVNV